MDLGERVHFKAPEIDSNDPNEWMGDFKSIDGDLKMEIWSETAMQLWRSTSFRFTWDFMVILLH
jgi:hypothetical protein